MDGYDLQLYQKAKEKAESLNLCIETTGVNLLLRRLPKGETMGGFETMDNLYSFLCGYDWGNAKKQTTED